MLREWERHNRLDGRARLVAGLKRAASCALQRAASFSSRGGPRLRVCFGHPARNWRDSSPPSKVSQPSPSEDGRLRRNGAVRYARNLPACESEPENPTRRDSVVKFCGEERTSIRDDSDTRETAESAAPSDDLNSPRIRPDLILASVRGVAVPMTLQIENGAQANGPTRSHRPQECAAIPRERASRSRRAARRSRRWSIQFLNSAPRTTSPSIIISSCSALGSGRKS